MKGIFYFFNAVMIASMALLSACSKSGSNEAAPKTNGPVISSISVNQGSFQTQVVINGSGFGENVNDNLVYFNGELAVVDFAGTQQLTVEVPLAAGTGNITISVDNGPAVVGPKFTYVPSAIVSTYARGVGFATGLASDQAGNIYAVDGGNNSIIKITPSGQISAIFSQTNSPNPANDDQFHALALDNAGNIFATDAYHHTIIKITPGGDTSTFAGNGVKSNLDGTLLHASFVYPNGIVIDKNNTMYILDQEANTIRKISNGFVSTLAGGMRGFSDGTGSGASFSNPNGITLSPDGNLYVADSGNGLIRKVSPDGKVTTFAGSTTSNPPGVPPTFIDPVSIAADKNGNLYVGDFSQAFTGIWKVTPSGTVTSFAGIGSLGALDGPGFHATFNYPGSLVIDPSGNLYVGDFNNGLIRKIVLE